MTPDHIKFHYLEHGIQKDDSPAKLRRTVEELTRLEDREPVLEEMRRIALNSLNQML